MPLLIVRRGTGRDQPLSGITESGETYSSKAPRQDPHARSASRRIEVASYSAQTRQHNDRTVRDGSDFGWANDRNEIGRRQPPICGPRSVGHRVLRGCRAIQFFAARADQGFGSDGRIPAFADRIQQLGSGTSLHWRARSAYIRATAVLCSGHGIRIQRACFPPAAQ